MCGQRMVPGEFFEAVADIVHMPLVDEPIPTTEDEIVQVQIIEAFLEGLSLPTSAGEVRERLRTNGLHWRGNYVVMWWGAAMVFALPNAVQSLCVLALGLSLLVASAPWVDWLDRDVFGAEILPISPPV